MLSFEGREGFFFGCVRFFFILVVEFIFRDLIRIGLRVLDVGGKKGRIGIRFFFYRLD